jgi:hypothetical protein
MARHRNRRRKGLKCVTIELRETEIDALEVLTACPPEGRQPFRERGHPLRQLNPGGNLRVNKLGLRIKAAEFPNGCSKSVRCLLDSLAVLRHIIRWHKHYFRTFGPYRACRYHDRRHHDDGVPKQRHEPPALCLCPVVDFPRLFDDPQSWATAAKHVAIFEFPVNYLLRTPPTTVKRQLEWLRSRGEGMIWPGEAALMAQQLKELGAEVDFFGFDLPLTNGHFAQGPTACHLSRLVHKCAAGAPWFYVRLE